MANVRWQKHTFDFKRPSGTSRGVLTTKTSWFIIEEGNAFTYPSIGECSIIEGLSPDDLSRFESVLDNVCSWLNGELDERPGLTRFPAIRFGLEMFLLDKKAKGRKILFENAFSHGKASMLINGLVWMGNKSFMKAQVEDLIERGFSCIKIKVGTHDFEEELAFLKDLRKIYGEDFELRLDANGAFDPLNALAKLHALSNVNIHSIEQPIKPGQWDQMAHIVTNSPIPIALDEELIGIVDINEKEQLIASIKPNYMILKPSLLGGIEVSEEWIALAESHGTGWWITSALESNVGLNAISQYAYNKGVTMPQGLGTGSLYTNNFESPLYITGENINFDPRKSWNLNPLKHE